MKKLEFDDIIGSDVPIKLTKNQHNSIRKHRYQLYKKRSLVF